jgi:hypothetical protein
MRSISTRCRFRTSPSRSACHRACPPVKPGAGSGESQIGDIGRGSGRRSYRQQPWLSSLSAVPQARCARNPRRCQVLLTDRPECRGRPGPHRHGGVDSRAAADHSALRHCDVVAKARSVVGVIAPIVGGRAGDDVGVGEHPADMRSARNSGRLPTAAHGGWARR